jgi:hypothetical protein
MKWLSVFFIAIPLLGQAPAATPVPETEQWLTGSIDLGYRWNTGVSGSFDTYRSIVNLGSGPKFFGADFTIVDPKKRLLDRLDVRAYGWGDDPYSTLQVNVRKAKQYNFNADYRRISYFNNLPSFADPSLAQGIVLNQEAQDTHRRITSLQLELLPGNWLVPYLAFDRDSDTGTGVNAFVDGGNEYAVPTRIRNSVSNYRGGVRLEFKRFHATLEQGGTTFKDDQNVYTAGSTNYGNNPVPLLGQTLDLTSLSQSYGIRGTSIYSKGLFTTNALSWLDLYGQILYSRPDTNVHYQDYATGNLADISQLLFYAAQQYMITAEARVPHKSASIGAEIRPLRRVRILESWLTDRIDGSSSASVLQTITPTSALLAYSLATNYNREQIDIIFDLTAKLTLRGGYRYVWGNASDNILPIAELTGYEQGKLSQNIGVAGATYRPIKKVSITGEVEVARSGGSYFRTSLYNYEKLKIQARYRIAPTVQISADGNLLKNRNPTPGVNYDYFAHQESVSLNWAPKAIMGWDFQGSYTRSTMRSNINYLVPQTLLPEQDFYRDNQHSLTFLLEGNLPAEFKKVAKLSVGGSFFLSSGSRPTNYFEPFVKLTVPLNKQFAWVSDWRYYGFNEGFYAFENFHTNLISTGVRFTR